VPLKFVKSKDTQFCQRHSNNQYVRISHHILTSSLAHKVLDHSVKDRSLEVKGFTAASNAFLAGAEGTKVLSGLGNDVLELENKSMVEYIKRDIAVIAISMNIPAQRQCGLQARHRFQCRRTCGMQGVLLSNRRVGDMVLNK
jgi:hypothetical protein